MAWTRLCLGLLLVTAALADPPYYRRDTDWVSTLIRAREELLAFEADEANQAKAPTESLSDWHSAGPFFAPKGQEAYELPFAPEQGIDLAAKMDNGGGEAIPWVARPDWQDGKVWDLPRGDHSATYLYRTVTVLKEREVPFYLGSDDSFEFFVDGRRLAGKLVPRGAAPNQDKVVVKLAPGTHTVLFKIVNLTGGYAFYFSTDIKPADIKAQRRAELLRLVRRDFPAAAQEIDWETTDGIWTADWPAGKSSELLPRYREATVGEPWRRHAGDRSTLPEVRRAYLDSRRTAAARLDLASVKVDRVKLAIADLTATYGDRYPNGARYAADVETAANDASGLVVRAEAGDEAAVAPAQAAVARLLALRREALLANPLLDFDKLLVVKRRGGLGLPQNWQGNSSIGTKGYDNELAILSLRNPDAPLQTLYKPADDRFVGDMCLHWNADRLLFSMPSEKNTWQVWELPVAGGEPTLVTSDRHPDVHNFDACYLPDGRVIYCSTACFQGVPCVTGSDKVSLLYLLDRETGTVRQLTFDQDHSWDPMVMPDGRVVYTRWEYSDSPHYFTRLLFQMNPDGSNQREFYGSNSYWPNSMFYTRPVPGHATQVATIVSGHHGERRAGELILLDPARGRREADGVVQRLLDRGKPVEPKIVDQLVADTWPKFLHPAPLSSKYFLAAARTADGQNNAIYLVDAFDNMVLVRSEPGYHLFEPVPLQQSAVPPIIPDKVDPSRTDATVYMADVYLGPGLAGVPRGTVKQLRVYSYHFAYNQMGGHINIGVDGPWDVHRILGTVPVKDDGSARFTVPANTPIAVQPLDSRGRALQVMRSWMTAMPGEQLSCIGCHESQNMTPPSRYTTASQGEPDAIQPWRGPARGFSFKREVQPVLDRYCVDCHDGRADRPSFVDDGLPGAMNFTKPYLALHPFVRRPGPESDYHLQVPGEFMADTSPLIQMLEKGHHGVALDEEGWDRLVTWIDLNAPCHGTWSEHREIAANYHARRLDMSALFTNRPLDLEQIVPTLTGWTAPPQRRDVPLPRPAPRVDGWPFRASELERRSVDLGDGLTIELVKIPAGRFVMGRGDGAEDEGPPHEASIDRPFWMATREITNAIYARFDRLHDSAYISETNKDQTRRGVPVNGPQQPVVRVSVKDADAFCRWLSQQTGLQFALPTEAQWEWACRAGTDTPFWFGGADADFGKYANLADAELAKLARANSPKWLPRVETINDGAVVARDVGSYAPNPWGLYDMIGNVAEWTASAYGPYGGPADESLRVVRGGSWYHKPDSATAAWRWRYPAWQGVFNVGIRPVAVVE